MNWQHRGPSGMRCHPEGEGIAYVDDEDERQQVSICLECDVLPEHREDFYMLLHPANG